uniref:Uncharacterized protein n=1 Tax=Rhizophora mucronata TaxID=61149 RepID=A0A2P2N004_RHIMU
MLEWDSSVEIMETAVSLIGLLVLLYCIYDASFLFTVLV